MKNVWGRSRQSGSTSRSRSGRVKALGALLFQGFLLSQASSARAQTLDAALAEELFQQGQALMQEQRYDEACPKLAESQRLDPSTGTLLNLAVCHEKEGRLATAWSEFNEALARARRDGRADRASFAQEHIQALEPQLSRLAIVVSQPAALRQLEVRLDGTVVGRAAWGVALPIDPGKHHLQASAPGKKSWEVDVEVPAGASKQSVSVPVLADAPNASASGTAAGADDSSDGSTQRVAAWVAGGVGVLGLGLGTVFGLDALSQFDRSNEQGCNGNVCDETGTELRNAARQSGDLSTVAFIVGGVALGAGIVLFATAPNSHASTETAWTVRARPRALGGSFELGASW